MCTTSVGMLQLYFIRFFRSNPFDKYLSINVININLAVWNKISLRIEVVWIVGEIIRNYFLNKFQFKWSSSFFHQINSVIKERNIVSLVKRAGLNWIRLVHFYR
jgi:hypothetical protein